MPMFAAVRYSTRFALTLTLLSAALPAVVAAQARVATESRVEEIVVTAESVRIRTAPSMQSLSIDEYPQGSVFAVAGDDYQTRDFYGIILDGRVVYVPRFAVAAKASRVARAAAPASRPAPQVAMAAPAPAAAMTAAPVPTAEPRATAPTPSPAARPAAAVTPSPAPAATGSVVALAGAPRSAPAPALAPAPAPVAQAPAAAPAPVAAAPAPAAPSALDWQIPTPTDSAASKTGADKADQAQRMVVPRPGIDLTVGLLASAVPVRTAGVPTAVHVSGLSFFGAQYRGWGAYVAPSYGKGGQFNSTTLSGGLSRDLVWMHQLKITALAGYARYSETSVDTTMTVQGPSYGGLVSLPMIGPLRLACRGEYIMPPSKPAVARYSVGFIFF